MSITNTIIPLLDLGSFSRSLSRNTPPKRALHLVLISTISALLPSLFPIVFFPHFNNFSIYPQFSSNVRNTNSHIFTDFEHADTSSGTSLLTEVESFSSKPIIASSNKALSLVFLVKFQLDLVN